MFWSDLIICYHLLFAWGSFFYYLGFLGHNLGSCHGFSLYLVTNISEDLTKKTKKGVEI